MDKKDNQADLNFNSDEILTDEGLAQLLKISKQTVFNRICAKKMMPPHFKIGSSRRYLRDEVIAWVRARQSDRGAP